MDVQNLANYRALLRTRRKGAYRNLLIIGGVFFVSLAGMLILMMLEMLTGRALVVTGVMVLLFGTGFLSAYARYVAIKEITELVDYLLPAGDGIVLH